MQSVIHSAYFSNDILKKETHYHDCHQIIFIKKGSVKFTVNATVHTAGSGDILIFSRYENHSVDIESGEYERYVLRISPFAVNTENKVCSLFLNRPSGFKNVISAGSLKGDFEDIFEKIIKEKNSNNIFGDEMQKLLLSQLIIMISRINPEISASFEDEKFDMIFDLQKRFENNPKEQYTLISLAKDYHISVSALSHQFKTITGFSVFEYLYSCRIATAKNLLTKSNLNIGQIVEECGFSDDSNFSRTFKKYVGITPSRFRKSYKT